MSAAGVDLQLRLGQRVRISDFRDQRVTGHVRGLWLDDGVLTVDVALEAPIVIEPRQPDERAIELWHQRVRAHEVTPLDDRDELIAEMLEPLAILTESLAFQIENDGHNAEDDARIKMARAVIAKATEVLS